MSIIKERIAWLRRMPLHWKLLLSSQLLFTTFAIGYRQKLVERRRRELLYLEEQEQQQHTSNTRTEKAQ
jgi:hypothetical protein